MLDNVGLRYPHRASGAKAPRTLRPLPLLRFAVSATGGAHLCSIQYYLRFWLGICRTSLAVSALRIMRYCLKAIPLFAGGGLYHLHFAAAWPMRSYRVLLYNGHSFLPCRICMAGKLCYTKVYLKTKKMTDISQTQAEFKAKSRRNPLYIPRLFNAKSRCVCRNRRYFRRFRYTPGQLLRQKAFRPEQRTCFICAAAGGAPTLFFILYSF